MAAEPKKPRIETEDDVSSSNRNDNPEDPVDDIVKEKLHKLDWYMPEDIKFDRKSDLTDVTFVVEGKKIYAGRDFLSLYSSYFKSLLNGDFAERNMEEIELKDVTYDDFHEMLKCLVNSYHEIQPKFAESLLTLGDRFDIKYLVDRIERFFVNSRKDLFYRYFSMESYFSVSAKLLLADKFRLIRLQTECFGLIGLELEETAERVENSEEFGHLSESAKNAYYEVKRNLGFPINPKTFVSSNCVDLTEVEDNVAEPPEGLISKGVLTMIYGGEQPQTTDLSGLTWSIFTNDESDRTRSIFSSYLVVNKNRPSSFEWSVEGIVKEEIVRHDKEKKEKWRREKKYKFSLNNSNRVSRIPQIQWKTVESDRNTTARFTIFITNISGVRKGPSFDFSSPDCELANSVFIVEGQKIHVNKQYISMVSWVFHNQFYDTNEVELKNVKYKEFIDLLQLIYPSNMDIIDDSAELFELAAKLHVEVAFGRLMETEKISFIKKLTIGDQCWGEKIEEHFAGEITSFGMDLSIFKTAQDFKDLKKLPIYNTLSYEVKAELFERMMELIRRQDMK